MNTLPRSPAASSAIPSSSGPIRSASATCAPPSTGTGRGKKVGYIDVSSVAVSGEAARTLSRGSFVAVSRQLGHQECEQDDCTRHAHGIVGHVEFLGTSELAAGISASN